MRSSTFAAEVRPGIALCLSGGGYRAMLFHVGALWRLYELDWLRRLTRVSSVSGGSITAATFGLRFGQLGFEPAQVRADFVPKVVEPIRRLASHTIDVGAVLGGVLWFGSVSSRVVKAYRKHLFGGATLQDLPDEPRFVINATNVQSAALWRFSKPYMRDYRVGEVRNPRVELALAVAASSAFPPVLSPTRLDLEPTDFVPGSGDDLQREPFTRRVVLTDGGVYDNLGLETISKFETLLVSDGGGKTAPETAPKTNWASHSYRVLDLIDNQVRSLRKRELMAAYNAGVRKGAYFGIRTDITDYGLADAFDCPSERTRALADLPTRLAALEPVVQERLINWGYAVCDAALRKFVLTGHPRPPDLPYPAAGV